jgi:hypothetical protein
MGIFAEVTKTNVVRKHKYEITGDINHPQYSDEDRVSINKLLDDRTKPHRKILRKRYNFYISLMLPIKKEVKQETKPDELDGLI